MEMNGLGSQDDDFVRVARRYQSLGDVVRERPARFLAHVARNAYQRLRQNLDQLVPFPLSAFAPAGLLLASLQLLALSAAWGARPRRGRDPAPGSKLQAPSVARCALRVARDEGAVRSAAVRSAFALYALTFYLSLSLVDGRPRYYLFLLPFYSLAAVHFLVRSADCAVRGSAGWAGTTHCLLAVCLLLTLWGSNQAIRSFLIAEPRELAQAARRLQVVRRPDERVMARTCHVGAIAGLETEWLPNLPDVAALGRRLAARKVSYLAYGPSEQSGRPQLAALRTPARAPRWLRPLYVAPSGRMVLYRVLSERLPRPVAGEEYVTPDAPEKHALVPALSRKPCGQLVAFRVN
jgi:hypothetical protein